MKLFKKEKKKNDYIKVTENGNLYIEISDLINQDEFKETVNELLNSKLIKKINDRKKQQLQAN